MNTGSDDTTHGDGLHDDELLSTQLTEYVRYLDEVSATTAGNVVALDVVRPRRAHRGRWFGGAVAVAAIGAGSLFAVADRDDAPPASSWEVIAEGDGVFTPQPMPGPAVIEEGQPRTNSIVLDGVTATESFGLIAFGTEGFNFGTSGTLWQSDDGRAWERVPPNEMFPERVRVTDRGGPQLADIVEFDGTLVALKADGRPILFTDDLEHWRTAELPVPAGGTGAVWSLAAGPDRLVAAGSSVWSSADGETWEQMEARGVGAVMAAFHDGERFVALGSGTIGTSPDGRVWEWTELEPADFTMVGLAYHDGTHVAVGYEPGDDGVAGDGAMWRSTDGATTWEPIEIAGDTEIPAITTVAADADGFHALASDGSSNVALDSADGVTWSVTPLEFSGWPIDAAAFDGGAVAVGPLEALTFESWSPDDPAPDPAELLDADGNVKPRPRDLSIVWLREQS